MKRKILISIISITLALIWIIIILENIQMNMCLELRVPLLAKREKIKLQTTDFFDDELVEKIYLTKLQTKIMLRKIKKNANWKNIELDKRLDEKMKFYTRENIYDEIPNIENGYWIFTNRSNAVEDKHSVDELLNDMYYAVSLGILDTDNNILYYYEYDR